MSPVHEALSRAAEKAGGQLALAKAIGTTQSNVWTWLKKSKRGTPAEWVIPIETATGIARYELRPDLYPPPPSPASESRSAA
ncbi:transcriptional regulator [Methylorubrum extorquens]|uniref:transcriptional regulator n=1 Tax=Methylorubrum extorquens TaxID=408 RepID=UPI002238B59C|nr:helix-turn-helix domain-containing protein [Methylorubrum extorquens]UYW33655.1 helix-turn-helix domain-containing protein [Methylorubrum extorquens]